MKEKLVWGVLLALLLSGCGSNGKAASVENGNEKIRYEEGIWPLENWENAEYPFEAVCVPDSDTAVRITGIFMEQFQKQNKFRGYVPTSVFWDTENQVWVVTYAESGDYPSACISIAVRKENAQVLGMWLGE